ncbi:MAG: DUF2490 domain-containing protein [Alistipes sp.]|nr:DUF2490 domain-containing protein [Alistipes sp.]
MKKIILLVASALCVGVSALYGQEVPLQTTDDSDVQSRWRVALEIPLSEKIDITVSEQLRTKNNFQTLDKMLTSVALDFAPWKHIGFEGEYVFVNTNEAGDWKIKHRINLGVIGKLSVGRFDLSLRERVRMVVRSFPTDKYLQPDPFVTLRTRLKADYRNKSRWKPYAYAELYTTLNAPAAVDNRLVDAIKRDNYINRLRLCVGSTMKINAHNSMDFYYMTHFNRSYGAKYDAATGALDARTLKRVTAHVIGIDYKFKL